MRYSRWRVDRWGFSQRLFKQRLWRCSTPGRVVFYMWRYTAAKPPQGAVLTEVSPLSKVPHLHFQHTTYRNTEGDRPGDVPMVEGPSPISHTVCPARGTPTNHGYESTRKNAHATPEPRDHWRASPRGGTGGAGSHVEASVWGRIAGPQAQRTAGPRQVAAAGHVPQAVRACGTPTRALLLKGACGRDREAARRPRTPAGPPPPPPHGPRRSPAARDNAPTRRGRGGHCSLYTSRP